MRTGARIGRAVSTWCHVEVIGEGPLPIHVVPGLGVVQRWYPLHDRIRVVVEAHLGEAQLNRLAGHVGRGRPAGECGPHRVLGLALLRVWFGPGGSGVSPIKPLPKAYVKSRRYQCPRPARRVSSAPGRRRVPHGRIPAWARVSAPLLTSDARVSLCSMLIRWEFLSELRHREPSLGSRSANEYFGPTSIPILASSERSTGLRGRRQLAE